jgi:DNA repair protein RecO (recombination protein O)
MNWTDEAIILSVRPHGETAAVVEVLSREHGRHLGLVHGGRSRRLRPVLQMGNHVDATWRARLPEQLGFLSVELRRGYAGEAMNDPAALSALTSLVAMARLLPERDPHPSLFEVTLFVLSFIDDIGVWPALLVRWEVALLAELGFGLDLSACAAGGGNDGLAYVSPKSGQAVSASAGEPYRDKLLRLPPFLARSGSGGVSEGDILDGLRLTGYFLEHRVLESRGEAMPDARRRLSHAIETAMAGKRRS